MDSGNIDLPVEITLAISRYPTQFYCVRCKCPMFVHDHGMIISDNKVKIIIPGLATCPNPSCNLQYRFMGFLTNLGDATKIVAITVHRHLTEVTASFHCHECRTTVFQYNGDLLDMMPGKLSSLPVAIAKCPDSRCGIKFLIYDY